MNSVTIEYKGKTKVFENVSHTNAFVEKFVKTSDEWDAIYVNDLKVKWK